VLAAAAELDTLFRRDHHRPTLSLDEHAMMAKADAREAARTFFIINDGIPILRHASTLTIVKSLP